MAPGVNKKEIAVFLVFLVLFLFVAAFVNFPEIPKYNYLFGGEYGKIAEALVNGKGYANPFGTESGSTAWMPPLYTFLLALIFWFFGPFTPASFWALLRFEIPCPFFFTHPSVKDMPSDVSRDSVLPCPSHLSVFDLLFERYVLQYDG